MRIKIKYILVLSLLGLLMLISGCDKIESQTDVMKDKIKDEKVTSNINNVDNKKENIIIYFPNENATEGYINNRID